MERLAELDSEHIEAPGFRGNVTVKFVGMDAVEAAKVEVRAWLTRLGVLTEQVTTGQMVIESVEEHRKQRLYRARMDLAMPDATVLVTFDHPSNVPHEDLYVAIRNAFRAARRQLEEYFRTRGTPARTAVEPPQEISTGN